VRFLRLSTTANAIARVSNIKVTPPTTPPAMTAVFDLCEVVGCDDDDTTVDDVEVDETGVLNDVGVGEEDADTIDTTPKSGLIVIVGTVYVGKVVVGSWYVPVQKLHCVGGLCV
jgi:hypothetical protein